MCTLLIKLLHVPSFGDEVENWKALKSAIAAIRVKRNNASWHPTLVLRFVGDMDTPVARSTVARLEELSFDWNLFRVVMELSDEQQAAFVLGTSFGKRYLWVDDLTEAQAHQLLDDRGCLMPADAANPEDRNMTLRRLLFSVVGTRSLNLKSGCDAVLNEAGSLEQFLSGFQIRAMSDVDSLLNLKQPQAMSDCDGAAFAKLAELMIKNSGSVKFKEVSCRACKELEIFRAMYFHQPTFTCRWYTPAHRAAAEELLLRSSLPLVQEPPPEQQPQQPQQPAVPPQPQQPPAAPKQA